MLDTDLKEQLKEVFSRLGSRIELRVSQGQSPGHAELLSMLKDLESVSNHIQVAIATDQSTDSPVVEIRGEATQGMVKFRGVPGGHEFSSLVLAILNANRKGKLPDEGVINRVKAIQGPVRLTTYVSLSCENCPEVVQALNLMATLHPDFHHETVDGAIAQNEVEKLGIQGVPSVMQGDRLIHSGKIQFIDLLAKLEDTFGRSTQGLPQKDLGLFDVVVIGGGPAGSSAAIYSARKGLKTAVISERMGGQLQETKGIENMISVSYTEGARLASDLSKHLGNYPIEVLEYRRVSHISDEPIRKIQLESGETLQAKSIIIATGAKWRQLGIPGEKENIGSGVAFCAHCDGPFYKGKKVAVVGGGNSGVEAAIDLAAIAKHVTLFEYNEKLKADEVLVEKLRNIPNATILTQVKTTQVISDGKKVTGLEFQDLKTMEMKSLNLDGIFVQIGLTPNSDFVKDLVQRTSTGEIVIDSKGRTSAQGIYAAGDVTQIPFKQIVIAMGEGAKVALTAFEDRMRAS